MRARRSWLMPLILLAGVVWTGIFLRWWLSPFVEHVWHGHASKDWPSTQATISESQIVSTRRGAGHVLMVKYTYVVGGQPFEGHNIRFGGSDGTLAFAEHMARLFPVGPAVVHHDPNHPERSVLLPGQVNVVSCYMLGGGVLVTFAVGYIMLSMAMRWRNAMPG